jgi:hypothetical protein
MKKGKSVKINLFNNIKTTYGTVDSKDLKSIYINIQSWVDPKITPQNWDRSLSHIKREIKYTLLDSINQKIFKENCILDLDLRTSGILRGKKSFFNLEITLYTKSNLDFKSNQIKDSVKLIIKDIFKSNISNNKYFNFNLTKKDSNDKQQETIYLS